MRILKIHTLPSVKECSWIDKDYIMLHACFQLLVDCVEEEKVHEHCNYEHHKKEIDEVLFLYNWWKQYSQGDSLSTLGYEVPQEMLTRLIKIRGFLWT